MKNIGKHHNRELYYFDLESEIGEIKNFKNWILLLIGNSEYDEKYISKFFRKCIDFDVLEFKSQGNVGENLHLLFDMTMVEIELKENKPFIDICTTGDNITNLENAIWECFYVNALPEHADWDNLKILCSTIDSENYLEKVKSIFYKISSGWIPD